MNDIKDGGPAFPVCDMSQNIGTGETTSHQYIESGMTLRDYFAAKAMQGFITARANAFTGSPEEFDDRIGRWAYETADAMLRARETS